MNLTSVFRRKFLLPQLLLLLFVLCAIRHPAIAQQAQTQPSQTPATTTNAASMTLMYWMFLSCQHHLDVAAANFEQSGKGDASGLRNALQKQLNFSDADYAPVRASSERLAAEMQSLYAEVKSDPSARPWLSEARDEDVQAEMNTLDNSLSSQNKAALDALVVRLFSPRQPKRKAVQQ